MPRRSALATLAGAVALALASLGGAAPAGAETGPWWRPPQRLTWFWQLQGKIDNSHAVAAYDLARAAGETN